VLRFMVPPFGLWDGRDGTGRPTSGYTGLTAHRCACRSGLETARRRCKHAV